MPNGLMENIYNPDVLSCIANLSNDEVFTPPEVANAVLDMLPNEVFESKETKFLDPACKSGVFLREIAKRLIRAQFPDYETKTAIINEKKNNGIELTAEENKYIEDLQDEIDHVFKTQLYGIAITELTSMLSRRSVYCSKYPNGDYSVTKFDNPEGNIYFGESKHLFVNKKCLHCGAAETEYGPDKRNGLESHAYQFIHPQYMPGVFENMKFDVIIGNPPYQLSDGGNAASSKPLYHYFVEQANKLKPHYLAMIIPSRWYAAGKGLGNFRENMLNDDSIKKLVDFKNSEDCFPRVNIAGGICYFLKEKDYHGLCEISNNVNGKIESTELRALNEYSVLVRDNNALKIIRKVLSKKESTLETLVHSRNSFDLPSNERGHESFNAKEDYTLFSSDGQSYIKKTKVHDTEKIIEKYKVIVTYAMSGGNKPGSDGKYQILSSLKLLKPSEVCTETYLVLSTFDNEKEAENFKSYINTKFVRFMLLQALTSIHITKSSFCFVPNQEYTEDWTDEKLYKKYEITEPEQALIDSLIRPME